MSMPRRSWSLVVLALLAGVGFLVRQQFIGASAQAADKPKVQISSDDLARVEALSNTFRAVAKAVSPCVVRIQTTGPIPERPRFENLPEPFRRFFEREEGGMQLPDPAPERGTGSGVIIDADKGYVLTNAHVVRRAKRIDVRLADGRVVEGKTLGRDDKTDLGLVQIPAEGLTAAPLGDSDAVQVGDVVLAIGAPFGLEQTVSQGIISAKGRSRVGIVDYEDFIQTDAAINPGNSGGPLVNMRGEVIGINTAIATNPLLAGYMGVGFAIPSNMAKQILPYLIEGKEIERGYLGVRIQSFTDNPELARSLGLEPGTGVPVAEVFPRSPAAKAGIKPEDVILSVNGKPVKDTTDLTSIVASIKPGTTVPMTIWRNGKKREIQVEIGKQPAGFSTRGWQRGEPGEGGPGRAPSAGGETVEVEPAGMTVAALTPRLAEKYGWDKDQSGVVVTEVDPYGEAAAKGIRPGDLITAVQGEAIETPEDFERLVTKEALQKGVRLQVRDRDGTRLVLLKASGSSGRKKSDTEDE